ncbi:MAG: DUF421 domain-containing protein [Oscillospiraceae bacterium]|nr:DUF421 domain-containing protein [Oscillospiraceae bacterium]
MRQTVYSTVFCAAVSLLAMFGLSRITGRRQLSQMSYFDYINGITVGSIAAELAVCGGENWALILLAMVIYTAAVVAVSLASNRWVALRRFVEGKPILLLEKGRLYERNLAAARLDIHELLTAARCEGYFDLSQIEAAVWETNGKVSFLPKAQHRPLTPQDMALPVQAASLCTVVIADGQVMADCLRDAGRDARWLQQKLRQQAVQAEDVVLATVDGQGSFTVFERQGERVVRHVFL